MFAAIAARGAVVRAFVAIPCCVALVATSAVAQSGESVPMPPRPKPPTRHVISVYTGFSTVMDSDETGFTVSPSYRFRLTRRFAVGPIGAAGFFDRRTTYLALLGLYALPKAPVS